MEKSQSMADIVDFVQAHRWIWDIKMTDFFIKQWWNHFPNEVKYNNIAESLS